MRARLPSIAVAVAVVVIVVAVIAVAVTRDGGGADALTVNGQSISQATLNHELDQLAASEVFGPVSQSPGSVSSKFAAQWLTQRVAMFGIQDVLDDHDLEVSAQQRKDTVQQAGDTLGRLPKNLQDVFIDYGAAAAVLAEQLGSDAEVTSAVQGAMRKLDVSVDPKYGFWVRARTQVCAFTGCASANPSDTG